MTYGMILVFEECASLIVGNDVHGVNVPQRLNWSLRSPNKRFSYPGYRPLHVGRVHRDGRCCSMYSSADALGMMIRGRRVQSRMVQSLGANQTWLSRCFALGVALRFARPQFWDSPRGIVGGNPGMGHAGIIIVRGGGESAAIGRSGGRGWTRPHRFAETFGKVLLPEGRRRHRIRVDGGDPLWRTEGLFRRV